MPIYEYQGKTYDIATDDPAEARRKIQAYVQKNEPGALREFGRAAASTADVALNAITGTLDYLAYPAARAYYGQQMPPEQAAARARAETTSPKDMIGRAFGVTDTPQYQGEAARRGTQFLGEQIQPVVENIAERTGQPVEDVESYLGSATAAIAPGAARAAGPAVRRTAQAVEDTVAATGRAAVAPVRGAAQIGEGLFGGVTGRIARPGETPGPLQTPSSRIPLGETYIDPADWARFQRGEISLDQLRARPIQEFPRGPADRAALAMAGNEVPAAGQGMRAFGEALGRQYRRNPLTSAIDIGVGALGLPPPVATYRVGQGLADYYLSKRGFDPNLPQQLQAAQGQAGVDIMRQRAQNQPPRIPYNPSPAATAGPVAPQTMYVNPEGGAGPNLNQVGQAGLAQRYAPQGVPGPVTPESIQAKAAEQAARGPTYSPEQQAILDQIRARGAAEREAQLSQRAQAAMGGRYQAPAAETPVAPVKPMESTEQAPRTALDDYNEKRILDKNPALARNPVYQRRGTLSMILDDAEFNRLPTKADIEKGGPTFTELISQPVDETGFGKSYRYRDGKKVVEVITTTIFPGRPLTSRRAFDPKTGREVPVGDKWTEENKQPLSQELEERFRKK